MVSSIREFVKPYYEKNDRAHQIDHADDVFKLACDIANFVDYDRIDLVALASYLHDIQVYVDRANHHTLAYDVVMSIELNEFFEGLSDLDRGLVAFAVSEHRASYQVFYTSELSEIIASADRGEPVYDEIFARGLVCATSSGFADPVKYTKKHMKEKYGRDGYAKYPDIYLLFFQYEIEKLWSKIDDLKI